MLTSTAKAQDADALAKQLSNPIASLVSVPMQFNYATGVGVDDEGERFFINVQSVIPISIGDDWNMISRTVLPVVSQDDIFPGAGNQFGLGDTVQSLFFSPKALTAGGWTWGVGPVLLLPTATDELLGSEKWGAARNGGQARPRWRCGRRRPAGPMARSSTTCGRSRARRSAPTSMPLTCTLPGQEPGQGPHGVRCAGVDLRLGKPAMDGARQCWLQPG